MLRPVQLIRRIFPLVVVLSLPVSNVFGQTGGNGTGTGTGTGTGNGQTGGSGILIDAEGIVRPNPRVDRSGTLNKKRSEAFAQEHLDADLQSYAERRLVSLSRLESAYVTARRANSELPPHVKYLAGLQRIDFVFVDFENRDVMLAGPAEGFAPDALGRMRGLTTGRPPLEFDDLVVAFRSVLRGQDSIGCSIDPEPGRLANLQRWLAANSTPASSSEAKSRYSTMAKILGLEDIEVWGVPADCHYANVLVEADYTMKRIALGAVPSRVKGIRSQLSMLAPGGNSMQRWWFAPYYEAIRVSEDGSAYEITGQRVQLIAQEEQVDGSGNRRDNAFTRASTQRFAQLFTEHYPELAEKNPVFAQLQNLFDLAVVAALLQRDGVLHKVHWSAGVFLDSAEVASYDVPKHVPSTAMTRPEENGLMLGLIGGVRLQLRKIMDHVEVRETTSSGQQSFALDVDSPAFWKN